MTEFCIRAYELPYKPSEDEYLATLESDLSELLANIDAGLACFYDDVITPIEGWVSDRAIGSGSWMIEISNWRESEDNFENLIRALWNPTVYSADGNNYNDFLCVFDSEKLKEPILHLLSLNTQGWDKSEEMAREEQFVLELMELLVKSQLRQSCVVVFGHE